MKRIYIKEEVCIGCHLCEVFCKLEHSRSKDLIKAYKREKPAPLARISIEVNKPVSFSVRCQHCAEPLCVYSCLTGALTKEPGGLVQVDENRCVGCWTCVLACPFGAVKQDKERKKMVKCDLCSGKEVPACVAACPNEALVFIDEKQASPDPEPVEAK